MPNNAPMPPESEEGAAAPATAAPAAGPDEGGENPATKAIFGINEALVTLHQGLASSPENVPPGALEALQTAVEAYGQFVGSMGEAMGVPMGEALPVRGGGGDKEAAAMMKGPQSAQMMGRKAVPADMPSGRGIKPVPV